MINVSELIIAGSCTGTVAFVCLPSLGGSLSMPASLSRVRSSRASNPWRPTTFPWPTVSFYFAVERNDVVWCESGRLELCDVLKDVSDRCSHRLHVDIALLRFHLGVPADEHRLAIAGLGRLGRPGARCESVSISLYLSDAWNMTPLRHASRQLQVRPIQA